MVDKLKKYYQSLSMNEWLLLLFLGVFPFDKHAAVFVLYALSLSVLITFKKEKLKDSFVENKALLLLPLLYILFLIRFAIEGKFTSEVEKKISLLVVPLLFVLARFNWKVLYSKALKVYLISSVLSLLLCFVLAFVNFLETKDSSYFFYDKFSLIHAGHYSMMLCLAFAIALYFLLFDNAGKKQKTLLAFCAIFLAFGLFLLTAKAALISMFVIAFVSLGRYIKQTRQWGKAILAITLFLGFSVSSYFILPELKYRVDTFVSSLRANPQYADSTSLRKEIWLSASDLICDKPLLGYGSEADNMLFSLYSTKHTSYEFQKRYNAHNTFLQITLSIGIVGLLVLIILFLKAFYFAFKENNYIFLSYLIILLAAFNTESMLETEAGILYFCFFYCLFMTSRKVSKI